MALMDENKQKMITLAGGSFPALVDRFDAVYTSRTEIVKLKARLASEEAHLEELTEAREKAFNAFFELLCLSEMRLPDGMQHKWFLATIGWYGYDGLNDQQKNMVTNIINRINSGNFVARETDTNEG